MFREHNTEEIIEMLNENFKTTISKDAITIEPIKKENHTLEDLKQNLINELNNQIGDLEQFKSEIELLKIILNYKNHKSTNWQDSMYATNLEIKSSNKKD